MAIRKFALPIVFLILGATMCARVATRGRPWPSRASSSSYRGWTTVRLENGLVGLEVLPEIGGRVIQFDLGGKGILWVNPALAGGLPRPDGLAADGGWFNVGGDKIWPAPQGWDGENQWPGPPDAVLDGQPCALEVLPAREGEAAVRLTGRPDPRSGIRFSRVIRTFDGTTRVAFEATMTNVDTKPRRWGIWAHTQLDGGRADGTGFNPALRAWCPLNPKSALPGGYSVIFGEPDNPSFVPDRVRGLMRVDYLYRVGKIGLDSPGGWTATVDGESGTVFVQMYAFEPGREYPDGSSVEFWLNGTGSIRAYGRDIPQSSDPRENPYVFESELISPFARLEPGQSYTWRYEWRACRVGGDFPVLACAEAGLVCRSLIAERASGRLRLRGRFGVFAPGIVRAEFLDSAGALVSSIPRTWKASPLDPLVLDDEVEAPTEAVSVRLVLAGEDGRTIGVLARAEIRGVADASRWTPERAWRWERSNPWNVGFNYIPATAINSTEMWQAETFDPSSIDRELALAEKAGFNAVRVFVQELVWESDPVGLEERMCRFLALAAKRGLRTLFVLFDDCAFSTMTEPFLGRQPAVVPGEYANGWTPSPGPRRVEDRKAWPRLEAYVRGVIGRFRDDPRVLGWDVYNEPGNTGMGDRSLPLLEEAFGWARGAGPSQPLTAGVWGGTPAVTKTCLERSDIISFHCYEPAQGLERRVVELQGEGRPVLCTEWLNRPLGSLVETCLPVLARRRVGAFHWGLVNGKTQTHYPWGSKAGAPEPRVWQHDIFRPDFSPYDERELALFKGAVEASVLRRPDGASPI